MRTKHARESNDVVATMGSKGTQNDHCNIRATKVYIWAYYVLFYNSYYDSYTILMEKVVMKDGHGIRCTIRM
jgi:hypothetical protein